MHRKYNLIKLCERGLLLLAVLALLKFGMVQSKTNQAPATVDVFLTARTTVAADTVQRQTSFPGTDSTRDLPTKSKSALLREELGSSVRSQPDMTLWSDKRIAAYQESTDTDDLTVVAALTIPELDIKTPIYNGTQHAVLDRGAGLIKGTNRFSDKSGNVGIAAHRDGFFRGLKDVQLGQRINVATATHDLVYRVSNLQIVTPKDIHVLKPSGKTQLTLVTCYPFYFIGSAPERFIVTADLVSSVRIRAT